MQKTRTDKQGRKLKRGETYDKIHDRYVYRFQNKKTGKRQSVYGNDLYELRKKTKEILETLDEDILTPPKMEKITLNEQFERYLKTSNMGITTETNYRGLWENHIKETIGNMRLVDVKTSHIKTLYKEESDVMSRSTIKIIHNFLKPTLELAVEDGIIKKNPANFKIGCFGREPEEREALTPVEQKRLLAFLEESKTHRQHLPMFNVLLGTGLRCSEFIGLTQDEIDYENRVINVKHQLVYKKIDETYKFMILKPKTKAGERTIPMSQKVYESLKEIEAQNNVLGYQSTAVIDGVSGFINITQNGNPKMPGHINSILYSIVKKYNKKEEKKTVWVEGKEPIFIKQFSSHILRHTFCTNKAMAGMNPKMLQYIMGHANIGITMDVYAHIEMRALKEELLATEMT